MQADIETCSSRNQNTIIERDSASASRGTVHSCVTVCTYVTVYDAHIFGIEIILISIASFWIVCVLSTWGVLDMCSRLLTLY